MEGEIIKEEIEKEEEKKKLSIFSKIIIVILLIVLLGLIFYIRFYNTDYLTEPIEIIMMIGGVLITIVIIGLINWFRKYIKKEEEELTEEEFKKKKKTIRFYWILFLSFCCSAFVYFSVFYISINKNLIASIAFFAFAWGITFMFFELFELINYNIFDKLLHLPYYLIVKLFTPMTLLIPMFLGAIHGKYNYSSTFLSDVQISFSKFGIIGEPFYRVIKILYNLGESRPIFIIFLCIAALLFLIWYAIITTFKPDIDSIVKVGDESILKDIVGVETEKEEEKSNVYRNI